VVEREGEGEALRRRKRKRKGREEMCRFFKFETTPPCHLLCLVRTRDYSHVCCRLSGGPVRPLPSHSHLRPKMAIQQLDYFRRQP
jgi:hypothetical protein